jgi:hypothetical protein
MITNDPTRDAPQPAPTQPPMGQPPRGHWQADQVHGGQVYMGPTHAGQTFAGQPFAGQPSKPQQAPTAAGRRKKVTRPTTANKRRPSGPTRAYVAMWAVLAGVSMAYLAVLTVSPEVLTAMGAPVIPGDPESNHGQRFAAKLATDVQSLQQTVTQLQGEVSALRDGAPIAIKTAAQPADLRSAEALPEQRAPEPKLQARLGAPLDGTRLDGTRVAGMIITNPGLPQPAPAQAFAQPVAAAPTGPLGLELVTGPSVDSLRLNWGVLAERHGATLKNLEVKYVAGGPNGPFQLLAGPVASAEDGFRICEQFRVKGTPCKVGPFQGQGF